MPVVNSLAGMMPGIQSKCEAKSGLLREAFPNSG
jgi:hypothetical protein